MDLKNIDFFNQCDELDYKKIDYKQYQFSDDKEEEAKSVNKVAKPGATYFTATYFGLMKKNKKEYKLKESDQADLLWRSVFIFTV